MLRAYWQMLFICIFSRPGIVHVHTASRASFVRKSLLLAIARLFGCKTIFHLHGAEFQQFSRDEAGPIMRWWIRRTLEKSSKVIALSDSWAEYLLKYAPLASIEVVSNSVKVVPLPAHPSENSKRILFLGRADKRKGIYELLSAIAITKLLIPEIKLAIGGDGDLEAIKAEIVRLGIEKNVEILGWVNQEKKLEELAHAGVFTLPSYDEGLPMSMLEAMAAGKAVLVTPVGGIPEAIQHGINGLLVPVGDAKALSEALVVLISNQELRQQLGQKALKTVKERFSTDVVLEKLSSLYRELGYHSISKKLT
jgi:glycosyltransferase involved in cell wall biosynthesis